LEKDNGKKMKVRKKQMAKEAENYYFYGKKLFGGFAIKN